MTTGSLAAYAQHIGTSGAYVTKLRAAGRLVLVQDGQRPIVDFEASDRRVRETAQLGSANNGANARGSQRDKPVPDQVAERVAGVYRQSQAQHKAFTAKLSELEYRKRAGLLVERTVVDAAVFHAFRTLRDAIMAAPRRCAALIVAAADMREAEAILADELRRAFEDFERVTLQSLRARLGGA